MFGKPQLFIGVKISFGLNAVKILCVKLLVIILVFILDTAHRGIQLRQQIRPGFAYGKIVIGRTDLAYRDKRFRIPVHVYGNKGIQLLSQELFGFLIRGCQLDQLHLDAVHPGPFFKQAFLERVFCNPNPFSLKGRIIVRRDLSIVRCDKDII